MCNNNNNVCLVICDKCEKINWDNGSCGIYAAVPNYYVRQGACYFNRKVVVKKKVKIRAGQQKGYAQRNKG